MERYTIIDFNRDFPDDDACLEYVKGRRWPDGIHCIPCGQVRLHHRVRGRTAYACDYCGHHVYPLAGTIFEKSTTSLRYWFYAMYVMGATRCGVSAKQIQRETGVTYKTAWRIFREIRSIMAEPVEPLSGEVEIDETYIGGKRRGVRGRPGPGSNKTAVVAAVERRGKLYAATAPNVTAASIMPFVRAHILPRTNVYTDELGSYNRLAGEGYVHQRVHHSSTVYVSGTVHTNTVEGFWSLVKRGINGVYHAVSEKYLQSYLNEYSFRYNRRDSERPIFWAILSRACASRGG